MTTEQRYAQWQQAFADDPATAAELAAIANDPAEIEDRFYTELSFGTAGMRGLLGAGSNRMNLYNVRRATRGLSDVLLAETAGARRGVVIAYDSRRYSAEFAREAALVLCAQGIRVYLFDELHPVPALSFAVRHLHAMAGIVITASHNPPQYNGYKVYWEDGAQLPPERAAVVLARIGQTRYEDALPMEEAEALAQGLLQIIGPEVDDAYIQSVKALRVKPALMETAGQALRIVYTPLHGSGNKLVRRILAEAGFPNVSVVREQELPDPDFSTIPVPNPEDPEAFRLAIALSEREGADCVIGTDPDCDRVGVAVRDDSGQYALLSGNQIGCILLYYILHARSDLGTLPADGAVVKSLVSTELARKIAQHFDVETFDTLTGFKFIAEKIQAFEDSGSHTFLFGFEESYGYLSGTDVRDKDGVNASMLIAEAAAWAKSTGKTLYDILQELYRRYGTHVEEGLSVELPGKDGMMQMQRIMDGLRAHPPQDLGGVQVIAVRDYLRGVRIAAQGTTPLDTPPSDVLYFELTDGAWVCIRPSGTEPKIKLYVNTLGPSESLARGQSHRLSQAARQLLLP